MELKLAGLGGVFTPELKSVWQEMGRPKMKTLDAILSEVFRIPQDEIHEGLTMDDIQHWDSLTHMDLITSIEQGLRIQLTMDEIMTMKDVKSIRSIVAEK